MCQYLHISVHIGKDQVTCGEVSDPIGHNNNLQEPLDTRLHIVCNIIIGLSVQYANEVNKQRMLHMPNMTDFPVLRAFTSSVAGSPSPATIIE